MSNTTYRRVPAGVEDPEYVDDGEGYEEEYEETVDQPQEGGLFSTPGRTAAVIGAAALLIGILSLLVWMMSTRSQAVPAAAANAPGAAAVHRISKLVATEDQAPRKGSVIPDFEWTDARTGKAVTLSSFRGKPVFINFWGTWCPPCREEMPVMQRLYNTYKGQIEFIGVSMGPRDSVEGVASFVNNIGYNWLFVQDDTYDVAMRYQVTAVPSSYFVGPDGVVRAVHIGGMRGEQIEAYLQQLK